MDTRYKRVEWGKGNPRSRTSAANWKEPLRWNKTEICCDCGKSVLRGKQHECLAGNFIFADEVNWRRPRVFCASLADWLDDEVPIEWLADLLKLIHDTPNLDWLLLTKRPENWRARLDGVLALELYIEHVGKEDFFAWVESWMDCIDMPERGDIPQNIWIGTTVENQEMADKRIPELLKIPAKVRFLSVEPLLKDVLLYLGNINHDRMINGPMSQQPAIDWVIVGGESGMKARPCNVEWIRSVVDQCKSAGVRCFVKQLGAESFHSNESETGSVGARTDIILHDKKGGNIEEWPEDLRVREFPVV